MISNEKNPRECFRLVSESLPIKGMKTGKTLVCSLCNVPLDSGNGGGEVLCSPCSNFILTDKTVKYLCLAARAARTVESERETQ